MQVYSLTTRDRWRPLIAGIVIRKYYDNNHVIYAVSIGFRAYNREMKVGFVTAGHFVADSNITEVYQPIVNENNFVGWARDSTSDDVDYAFIEANVTVVSRKYSEISITNYDYIVDYKVSTDLKEDDYVEKVGYNTSVTSGIIKEFKYVAGKRVLGYATYKSGDGDSGGFVGWVKTIYKPDYPKDYYLYGIHKGRRIEGGKNYAMFVLVDRVMDYGIYPDFSVR